MRTLFIFLVMTFLSGCTVTDKISNQNLAYLYRSTSSILHPEFHVYHFSDDSSRLYFRINTEDLLFIRGEDGISKADFTVSCRLLRSFDNNTLVDSTSLRFLEKESAEGTFLSGYLNLRTGNSSPDSNTTSVLEINISDNNRKLSSRFFTGVNKSGFQNRQSFLIRKKKSGAVVYNYYIPGNDTLTIEHRNQTEKNFYVRYYNRDFPIADPPFAVSNIRPFEYASDSSFVFHMHNLPTEASFSRQGFYHIQEDTLVKEGLTLFRFHDDFPRLTSPAALLEPLRYLTTRKEFEDLYSKDDKKAAVDNFWLALSGNIERGKELIRKYYNRVKDANVFFSSYIEGWKTDRGMIYIIFGVPNIIYKTSNSESWIYGEAGNMTSINFTFIMVNNPFSDNDFILQRSPIYESYWYHAVDTWRTGRVYND